MVVLLLIVLTLQTLTGLIGTGDGLTEGPRDGLWPKFRLLHTKSMRCWVPIIIILVVLRHIMAVCIHQIAFKEEMIKPMISGYKRSAVVIYPPKIANPGIALMCWVLATTVASFLFLI